MDAAWIGVIGALAGTGTGLGGFVASSGEYRKWLREQRHSAATELLAAGEALRRGVHTRAEARGTEKVAAARSEDRAGLERLRVALEAVRLIFPLHVVELAEQYTEAATAFTRINVNGSYSP